MRMLQSNERGCLGNWLSNQGGGLLSVFLYRGDLEPPLFFYGVLAAQIMRIVEWVNRSYLICFGVSQKQSVYVRGKRAGCSGGL
jgi:hypothetical protein